MKTAQEKNALIAEFLGWKQQTDPQERWYKYWLDTKGVWHKGLYFTGDLEQLREVLEKINRFGYEEAGHPVRKRVEEIFKDLTFFTPVSEVYDACVEFINWYNANNHEI